MKKLVGIALLVCFGLIARQAYADAATDNNNLSIKCSIKNPPYGWDSACIRKHASRIEKLVFDEGYDSKLYLAEALLNVYQADGKREKTDRLEQHVSVYRQLQAVSIQAHNQACGCNFSDGNAALSDAQFAFVFGQEASFLEQQGKEYAADAAYARRFEKFYRKQAKGPSFLQQLAVAANSGFDAYAVSRGAAVPQPQPAAYPVQNSAIGNLGTTNSFVDGVPQCGGTTYENGDLIVLNNCDIQVSISWTSAGDVWGAAFLGPMGRQNTGQTSDTVRRAGGVHLFTCPGNAWPEDTQGKPVGPQYSGQYRCRR